MNDPNIRCMGAVDDIDGLEIRIGTDYDAVTIEIGGVRARLADEAAEQFAKLFIGASWEARRSAWAREEEAG